MSPTFGRLLLVFLVSALNAFGQVPDRTQSATVHLYRTGAGADHFTVYLDGEKILKIGNYKEVTFFVSPGSHELSLKFANRNPTALLKASAGQEYFFHADCESSVGRAIFNGANAVSIALDREEGIVDADRVKLETIDPKTLEFIYTASLKTSDARPVASPSPILPLSDDAVEQAIVAGSHNDSPESIGLYLNDTQMNVASHVLAEGAYANSGFSVKVYTPQRWIEYQSSLAHRFMKPFTSSDVTPEMRLNVLHVVALPRMPDRLDAAGMSAGQSVARVVLMDKERQNTIQPLSQEQGAITVDSALRSKDYAGTSATFNALDVSKIRNADKGGEFFVVVIGEDGSRKFFDVKSKFKNWL